MLGAGIDVALAQILAQVLAGALADILSADGSPGNVLDLHGGEDGILLAVDDQSAVLGGDLAGELAVHAVVLQHVGHILGVHEGIVQPADLHIVTLQGGTEDETADAAEAIDTDFGVHTGKTPFTNKTHRTGASSKRLRKRFCTYNICILSHGGGICNCQFR